MAQVIGAGVAADIQVVPVGVLMQGGGGSFNAGTSQNNQPGNEFRP